MADTPETKKVETEHVPKIGPSLRDRVDVVLERVRPYVAQDGGYIELVNVNEEDGVVFIRFQGSCHGCPSSMATLQMGIENELKAEIPEIKQVLPV